MKKTTLWNTKSIYKLNILPSGDTGDSGDIETPR